MGIILLILKILIISVLVILGIALSLLLLVLFLPIVYKVKASYNKQNDQPLSVFFKIRWLCIKFYSVQNDNGQVKIIGRVLGIKIYSREIGEEDNLEEENLEEDDDLGGAFLDIPLIIPDDYDKNHQDNSMNNEDKTKKNEEIKENKATKENKEKRQDSIKGKLINKDNFKSKSISNITSKLKQAIKESDKDINKASIKSEEINDVDDKISSAKDKINNIRQFLKKKYTKKAYKLVVKLLKRLLKELMPRKLKGELSYGALNPATTGKITGYIAMLIPFYKNNIKFYPDFTEKKLEGEIVAKGRIQIAVLVIIAVRVYFNKEIRRTIKEFKKI